MKNSLTALAVLTTGVGVYALWMPGSIDAGTQPATVVSDVFTSFEETLSSGDVVASSRFPDLPAAEIPGSAPVPHIDAEIVAQQVADRTLADLVATGSPEGIMQFYAERRRARARLLQRRMDQENSDAEWSADLKQRFQIAGRVVPALSGLKLDEADCRESICALRFGFTPGSNYDQYAPFMANFGIVLGTDAWVHPDAEPDAAMVYVARPDETLPDLEPTNPG